MSNASPTPPSAALLGQHAAGSSPESHDSSTLPQGSPQLAMDMAPPGRAPEGEKHPKGKKKRTATKDKMILEEAYKKNPKPDKQARFEIVDRVSLNEKEVQIWFQNRRQNDRRKSRLLSPEELAAIRYGGMHNVSLDPVTSRGAIPPGRGFPASDPDGPGADRPSVSPPLNDASPHHSQSSTDASTPKYGSQESNAKAPSETSPQQSHEAPSSQRSQGTSDAVAHSFSTSVGYLANRWNLGSSFSTPSAPASSGGDSSHRLEHFPPSSCSSGTTHNANRSQSLVRLSLSLEGKAELVSSQPSPPREPPLRPASALPGPAPARREGLQRSHSALPSINLPPISALTGSLPRLIRGRSRDVHAWESCAESDRRDELTAQAEHESSGSAIAAISLLRSSSGILQPSAAKRNAPVSRPQPRQAKRAKLGQANSTYARLENVEAGIEKRRDGPNGKAKDAMLASPADSDKENWSPDEDGNPRRNPRRRLLPAGPPPTSQNARRQGRILQEHKGPALLSGRANTVPPRRLWAAEDSVDIFEDSEERAPSSRNDEVEKFMRGEISPSKKGDMDCVAGLLSLSQGAWR